MIPSIIRKQPFIPLELEYVPSAKEIDVIVPEIIDVLTLPPSLFKEI